MRLAGLSEISLTAGNVLGQPLRSLFVGKMPEEPYQHSNLEDGIEPFLPVNLRGFLVGHNGSNFRFEIIVAHLGCRSIVYNHNLAVG